MDACKQIACKSSKFVQFLRTLSMQKIITIITTDQQRRMKLEVHGKIHLFLWVQKTESTSLIQSLQNARRRWRWSMINRGILSAAASVLRLTIQSYSILDNIQNWDQSSTKSLADETRTISLRLTAIGVTTTRKQSKPG